MRSFIVMAMFVTSLAHAGWTDYEEKRSLTLDIDGITTLSVVAGAGSMDVTGVQGLDEITVKALIVVPDSDKEKALKVIEKKMVLTLEQDNGIAKLDAWFEDGFMGFGSDAHIVLDISVPQGFSVIIEDGSGSLDVSDIMGDVSIDDGSGSIEVSGVSGDVSIEDGSGSISVKHVQGSVRIDDGSGSIRVSDVEQDLTIVDDGSGDQDFSDIRGNIDADT